MDFFRRRKKKEPSRPLSKEERAEQRQKDLEIARAAFADLDFAAGEWEVESTSEHNGNIQEQLKKVHPVVLNGTEMLLEGDRSKLNSRTGMSYESTQYNIRHNGQELIRMVITADEHSNGGIEVTTDIKNFSKGVVAEGVDVSLPRGSGTAFYEKGLDYIATLAVDRPVHHSVLAEPTDWDMDEWYARFAPVLTERGYTKVDNLRDHWEKTYPVRSGESA